MYTRYVVLFLFHLSPFRREEIEEGGGGVIYRGGVLTEGFSIFTGRNKIDTSKLGLGTRLPLMPVMNL